MYEIAKYILMVAKNIVDRGRGGGGKVMNLLYQNLLPPPLLQKSLGDILSWDMIRGKSRFSKLQ